jgi:hypothetical protein
VLALQSPVRANERAAAEQLKLLEMEAFQCGEKRLRAFADE